MNRNKASKCPTQVWNQDWTVTSCMELVDGRFSLDSSMSRFLLLFRVRLFLLGFCGSFCGWTWWFASCAFLAALCCRVFCATALTWGYNFVMFPMAFVLPSLNTMRMSVFKYSGFLMNRNLTMDLSPVRRCSLVMFIMVAVCRTLPTCTVTQSTQ